MSNQHIDLSPNIVVIIARKANDRNPPFSRSECLRGRRVSSTGPGNFFRPGQAMTEGNY